MRSADLVSQLSLHLARSVTAGRLADIGANARRIGTVSGL
jgi:hypothetical protein